MRLTRRGRAVVLVVLAAVGMAWAFGPRSLNAVAAPAIAALLVGAWQVRRAPEPTLTADRVRSGSPGEERTLRLRVDGRGVADVDVEVPAGLGGRHNGETVPLPTTVELPLSFQSRGVYDLEDVAVHTRDALGLLAEPHALDPTETVLVYPPVYRLAGHARLERLFADETRAERQEFDRLREYVPGDPLRNVHWKSSAKYDDYMVMEFAPTRRNETVRIAATAEPGGADAMARAAASLTVRAIRAGLDVAVHAPAGDLPAGGGEDHRENALRLLARTGPGTVPDGVLADADVVVRADAEGATVSLADWSAPFADLAAGRQPLGTPRAEVVA